MKLARINPNARGPHQITAFYHIRDADDPGGIVYRTLPPERELVQMSDQDWETRVQNCFYDPRTKAFLARPAPEPAAPEKKKGKAVAPRS